MTVKEMLQRGTWMRSMHEPKTAAREIAAQEKVYRYHVLTATAQHGEALVGAAQLTGLECQDMTFGLKRIMEEAIEMAAVLEGVGMETVVEMMATTYEQKQKDYNNSFGETQQLFGIVAGACEASRQGGADAAAAGAREGRGGRRAADRHGARPGDIRGDDTLLDGREQGSRARLPGKGGMRDGRGTGDKDP